MIHTVKGFDIINKAEADVFLELSCFSHDPADAGNLISGSSAFSKSSLNIWKFMIHILLKPGLENFEHFFTSMWDECNCAVVWTFFDIAFLWHWNEKWTFPVLWPLLSFPNLLLYWVKHFHKHHLSGFAIAHLGSLSLLQWTMFFQNSPPWPIRLGWPLVSCKVRWAFGSITMNKASGGDGIPVDLFQILKDEALWKYCTQYASKFGKLSSGHRTGKGQFSFQSQRKAMLKNA